MLMGCTPSSTTQVTSGNLENMISNLKSGANLSIDMNNPQNVLAAYMAIDQEIVQQENASPAPTFGQAVSRQRYMKAILQMTEESQGTTDRLERSETEEMHQLFLDLGLNRSPNVAAEHEEFVANANRVALNRNMISILKQRLILVEARIETASKKVSELQNLYQQQDTLLKNVFGENYGSEREKYLEQDLDTLRNYRDTMASGVLQWEECALDVRTASELAQKATMSWKSLMNQRIDQKLSLAAESRNNLQEAVFLIQVSQETLTGVNFPYCTARELTGLLQALEYSFTDILIDERYEHALLVYKNFHQRCVALQKWILKTLGTSIRKDLEELDKKVMHVVGQLRDERIFLLGDKLGLESQFSQHGITPPESHLRPSTGLTDIENTSQFHKPMMPEARYTQQNRYGDVLSPHGIYGFNVGNEIGRHNQQVFRDPNLQRDFEEKLNARRNAMWPSRRMEELRQLTL